MADKKYFAYFCDDTIRCLEYLNRDHPASVFDNPFFAIHKRLHDKYGFKVQFNLFFQNVTGTFNLGMMTADYKEEFEANSDWLKFGFHARQEFPDFPHLNSTYEQTSTDFEDVSNNIVRFAGKKCLTDSNINHWVSMSKEGVQALVDHGVKCISCTSGDKDDSPEARCALASNHIQILLSEKSGVSKPSVVRYYTNGTAGLPYLANHNNLTSKQRDEYYGKLHFYVDPETGMMYNRFAGVTLNATKLKDLPKVFAGGLLDNELVIPVMHEQYFYKDYYSYEPDYADKIEYAVKTLLENGFEHVSMYDLPRMQNL